MICYKCNGTGEYDIYNECPCCNGTGEIDITNEEWLKLMTTEELAGWIAKQKCDGCNDEPYDKKHGTCKYCMVKKTEQIRVWLKQPHQ